MDINYAIENTELTLQQIADQCGSTYKRVYNVWKKYPAAYRKARKARNYSRAMQGNTRGSRDEHKLVNDSKGYLLVRKPDWYTGRKRSSHVFQHSAVCCEGLGITEVPAGSVVHHCDENPHNNEFSNLVMLTMAEHSALHGSLKGATTISKESTLKWVEARRAL
jgi:hypothetical protein